MLPTDWSAPSSAVLRRLSDGRVQQYWDPDHVIATRMKKDARSPQPEQDCCLRSGILWDLAAVYPAGALWSDRMPTATMFNGPVVDVIPAIEEALAVAKIGVEAGADWLEIGTPLIVSQGLAAIGAMVRAFPRYPVLAD